MRSYDLRLPIPFQRQNTLAIYDAGFISKFIVCVSPTKEKRNHFGNKNPSRGSLDNNLKGLKNRDFIAKTSLGWTPSTQNPPI